MGNRDVSIVFKASDRLSESIKGMQKNVRGLSRDVSEYRKVQDTAFKEKAKISFDITQAKKELKELEKAVKQEVAGSKEAFMEKRLELERLNEEYRRLSEVAKEAGKAERQLSADISRSSNANASRGSGLGGLTKGLASAGLGKMLSGAATNYLNTTFTSVFGSTTGGMISGIGGSAISGAAMGSIAGPIGAAVGAAVGGLTGAINALAEKSDRRDEYFRDEVKSLHGSAISDMEGQLTNGSTWAAEREMYQRNYASMTDDATGAKLYNDIMKYGDTTPYDTSVMLGKGMEMLSYNIPIENVMELMDIIGNIAMGDANKFSGLSYAISQSMAAGKLNAQDKNQMLGYGFNPLVFVAKNQGVSVSEASKMMSDGKITSDMLIEALRTATSEGERYHDAVTAMSDTFNGLQGQLESAKKNIEIAMGEAYNESRKEGMAKEIEAFNGEMGEKMKEAYRMIGSYEAEIENQHQQSIIDAINKANEDIANQGLTGIDAERRMWEAKTEAEIQYKNSEEYQMKLAAEQDLIGKIQGQLAADGTYLRFGESMANEFSKGWKSVLSETFAYTGSYLNGSWQRGGVREENTKSTRRNPRTFATGLPRVPYDGFPAILHEGEQVLTRQEANQRSYAGVQIAKLADSIVVREDADIDKIARALVEKLSAAAERYA